MENQTVNNNDEVEIDLGEVFHLLLSKLGVIILSGIVFCLAAVMGTMLLITPKYESTTKIVVLSKQDSSTLTNQDIQTSTSLTKDYAELIKSRTVTEGVIAQLNLDMTHEELLKKLSVDTPTDTRVVSITVTDTDPYTAAQIANAVRDIASKHIQQVMDIKAVNVVETANIPDEPSSPSVPKNGVIGGLLGILLAVAVVIFAIFLDRRLIALMGVTGVGALLAIPSIANRITYLFTADYLAASRRAGRVIRWSKGLKLLQESNPVLGFGLGRFGGAVAMQNKVIEETKDFSYFYMDNYYLKTLVEMGYLGLAFFILLLFGLVLWSLRSIGRTGYTKGDRTRVLAVSMFAGMCGVLVHCYFENIFEVPYMMAYFWSMAAAVMYLGYFRKRKT